MDELTKELKPILQKVADFFDLFDLSYIVSGIASSTAISLFIAYTTKINPIDFMKSMTGFMVFLGIVVVYVFGLISWVIGKFIRNLLNKNYYTDVYDKFNANNGESNPLFLTYLTGLDSIEDPQNKTAELEKRMHQLYGMMWVKLRDRKNYDGSFSLLKRYWVQTATFEGLIFSSVLWFAVIGILTFCNNSIPVAPGIIILVLIAISFSALFAEAVRYRNYQLAELVQTYISISDSK